MINQRQLKRLVIDLPVELHMDIKKRAAERNITMKEYVLQALGSRINHEKRYE